MVRGKAKRQPRSENKGVQDVFEDWLAKQPVTHAKSKAGYVAEEEIDAH